jgi:hypothetical protein
MTGIMKYVACRCLPKESPGRLAMVCPLPAWSGRASFDFEHLTQPGVWDRYHGMAHG